MGLKKLKQSQESKSCSKKPSFVYNSLDKFQKKIYDESYELGYNNATNQIIEEFLADLDYLDNVKLSGNVFERIGKFCKFVLLKI